MFQFTAGAQVLTFNDVPVEWTSWLLDDQLKVNFDKSVYQGHDLVIIDDQCEFSMSVDRPVRSIKRGQVIFVGTEKGLSELSGFRLPESFDPAYDAHRQKAGRGSRIQTPDLSEYKIKRLGFRKYVQGKWRAIKMDYKYQQVRRETFGGEFRDEDILVYWPVGVKVGDVVQIFYEAEYEQLYGANIFYFYSKYPKINTNHKFIYKVDVFFTGHEYLLPIYVPDSCYRRSRVDAGDYVVITDHFQFRNMPPLLYPAHAREGRNLPHAFIDLSFYAYNTRPNQNKRPMSEDYAITKPKNFEWMVNTDTLNYYYRINDVRSERLRKFVAALPPAIDKDSSCKPFFTALCDTFNAYRYYTANHVQYNEYALAGAGSTDHLLRRRIVGSPFGLCRDILNDANMFYFLANLQDKRYGEHSIFYRAHFGYEREILAVPEKGSYLYFMMRPAGVKYHLNELPFYFEGTTAALLPCNFQETTGNKKEMFFKFIKTHKGTFAENTRSENALVRVVADSLVANLTIKESMSGQFSTTGRHVYFNDPCDSTISPVYFRKCTAKPGASGITIKNTSHMGTFPFRYNFLCRASVPLKKKDALYLSGWFSFPLSSEVIDRQPQQDFFLDFDFTDAYNYQLEFSRPVSMENPGSFMRAIDNDYYSLESSITEISKSSYLLKVKLCMKKEKIPAADAKLLMDLVKELDTLGHFIVAWKEG